MKIQRIAHAVSGTHVVNNLGKPEAICYMPIRIHFHVILPMSLIRTSILVQNCIAYLILT
jgi:hypothetical protein